mmetsp:Transcript_25779/g.71011  ORF Transcript_25779/g.71011 Transcript_25779/m.71011 type:complete len:226 (+) Transcript_25779:2-679(+)
MRSPPRRHHRRPLLPPPPRGGKKDAEIPLAPHRLKPQLPHPPLRPAKKAGRYEGRRWGVKPTLLPRKPPPHKSPPSPPVEANFDNPLPKRPRRQSHPKHPKPKRKRPVPVWHPSCKAVAPTWTIPWAVPKNDAGPRGDVSVCLPLPDKKMIKWDSSPAHPAVPKSPCRNNHNSLRLPNAAALPNGVVVAEKCPIFTISTITAVSWEKTTVITVVRPAMMICCRPF